MFEQAAAELEPNVRLTKLNADESPGVSAELGVREIPELFLVRNGNVIAQTAGVMDGRRIVAWVRSQLPALETIEG